MKRRKKTKFETINPEKIRIFDYSSEDKISPFAKNAMAVALLGLSQMSTVRTIFMFDLEPAFESHFKRRKVKDDEFQKVLKWFKSAGYVIPFEMSLTITQGFHDLIDQHFGFVVFENPLPKPGCEEENN